MRPLALLAGVALVAVGAAQQPPSPVLVTSPTVGELDLGLAGKTLTIDDAVRIALITNRDFAASVSNLDRYRAKVGQAQSELKLKAGVSGTIDYYDKPTTAAFGESNLTIVNQFSDIYNANISMPIDLFGVIHSAIDQAKLNEVAARIDVNAVRNQVVFQVRNAFFEALRAQGQLLVASDTLSNARTRLADAESMLKAGTGTQFDVLTAQRDVADAEDGVLRARGTVTIALGRLKHVIGINVSSEIAITDEGAVEEPSASDVPASPTPTTTDQLHVATQQVALGEAYAASVKEGLATRPEVLEAVAQIAAAERGLQFERRSSLPAFQIGATYNYQPNHAGFTPERQGALTFGFSVPILDGGLARARQKEAEAAIEAAKVRLREANDGVTLDVQEAYVNLSQAAERVRVVTVGLVQAREAFRLARVRAQAGVSSSPQLSPQLELSNAQTTLTEAETNRVNAIYDFNLARAALDRAIGRYSYGPGAGFDAKPAGILPK